MAFLDLLNPSSGARQLKTPRARAVFRSAFPTMKTLLDSGHDLFVEFCDYDKNWGFLLFLRPARHQALSVGRALAASILLGLPLGLFGSILVALLARELGKSPPALFIFPALLIAVYFVAAQLTLFRAWNRRAERLAQMK